MNTAPISRIAIVSGGTILQYRLVRGPSTNAHGVKGRTFPLETVQHSHDKIGNVMIFPHRVATYPTQRSEVGLDAP